MLFKAGLAQKIAAGIKTQTRRLRKNSDVRVLNGKKQIIATLKDNRTKYKLGNDYAVQYGYGQPGRWWYPKTSELVGYADYKNSTHDELLFVDAIPLRVRITRLRFEDVRRISFEDSRAEGFYRPNEFLEVWCGFYDKPALPLLQTTMWKPKQNALDLYERPGKKYQGIVIDFELVI